MSNSSSCRLRATPIPTALVVFRRFGARNPLIAAAFILLGADIVDVTLRLGCDSQHVNPGVKGVFTVELSRLGGIHQKRDVAEKAPLFVAREMALQVTA